MATMSHSSRGILTGMPSSGGGVIRLGPTDSLVHVCVDGGATQADTIYLYAYCVPSPPPGRPALVQVDAQERLDTRSVRTRLIDIEIPEPPHAPILVLNGVVKSKGALIYARAIRSDVSVYGIYTRQALALAPAAHTVVGSLVLMHQTVSVSAARESVVISSSIPVTFLVSNHMSETPANAYLGAAAEGTVKIITLVSKHPNATGASGEPKGNIRLTFDRFRLPDSIENDAARGSMLFQRISDSAHLIYSSQIGWSIIGSGVFVE